MIYTWDEQTQDYTKPKVRDTSPHPFIEQAAQRRQEFEKMQAQILDYRTNKRYSHYTTEHREQVTRNIKGDFLTRLVSWEDNVIRDAEGQRSEQWGKFNSEIKQNRAKIAKDLSPVEWEMAKSEWESLVKNSNNVQQVIEAYNRSDSAARLVAQISLSDLAKQRHPNDPANGHFQKQLERDKISDYLDPEGESQFLTNEHLRLKEGLQAARSASRDIFRKMTGMGGFTGGAEFASAHQKMDEISWQISADLQIMTGDTSEGYLAPAAEQITLATPS